MQEAHQAEYATKYGEPGYTDPESGILFANWNNIPEAFSEYLDSKGYELEWSDEWTVHEDKAYRTRPDCYSWEPSFILTNDGEMLTRHDSASDIIDEVAMTDYAQPTGFVPSWNLEEEGYTLYKGKLESGWHEGQTDDPEKIAKEAFDLPDVDRVIFRKVENSQFYIVFECWMRKD